MFISLSGQLGSGKSTICKYLKEKHGFGIFSTGEIHRRIAKEKGLSTLNLNKELEGDIAIDRMIDDEMMKYAEVNKRYDMIFDSRMAWHFLENSFKVFLLVSPKAATERVFNARSLAEESYETKEAALNGLISRREIENERFKRFYGVDCNDYANYDLIIDTTESTVEDIAETILDSGIKHYNKLVYDKYLVCPRNIYPTVKISGIDPLRIKFLATELALGTDASQLTLIKNGNSLFINEGHHKTAAAIGLNISLLYADSLTEGEPVKLSPGDLKEWEASNGFEFGFYPN